jgi:hypothetical protein
MRRQQLERLPPGRRLEELRRIASNSELRSAYQTAIGSLNGVIYRLAMLRALDAPKPARRPTAVR